jgi:hypothetical protein
VALWHSLQKLAVAFEMFLLYRPGKATRAKPGEYPPGYLRPLSEDSS